MDTKKFIRLSGITTVSLVLLASCSDSTSPANEFSGDASIESSATDFFDTSSSSAFNDAGNGENTSSNSQPAPQTSSQSGNAIITSSSATTPSSSASLPGTQSSSSIISAPDNENIKDRPVITYTASGATVTNAGNCVTVEGGTVKISCGGEYDFSGSYSGNDGQILVATAKTDTTVYLNMKGLTLTNTADAPIYIQKANKAFVVAKNGTTNTFSDAATRTTTHSYTNDAGQPKSDTTGACIYSKDDLTLKGEGTLVVKANYNNGIHSTNDLRVKNGLITVNAKNNGLKGKGSVAISGGTINITTTAGDGIKSDDDDATDLANGKGSIEITGGSITITSAFDGITANNVVTIAKESKDNADNESNGENKAPTIKITTGGGQNCLGASTGGNGGNGGNGGRGGFGGGPGGGFPGGFGGGNSCAPDSSMKGIKSDSSIVISDGIIEISSRDDGIHSGGTVTFTGGKVTVKTDDDGVHADKALYVKDNANVSVTMAYEGMESPDMNFEGGITSVITTDDGWNAAGGTSTMTGNTGGRGGWGGGFGGGSTGNLKVTGGFHYIYVGTGDTDGIDSNGGINISGGVIIVECRMNGGMGGMVDSDGSTTISGGKLLGFGTNNSEEGKQYSVNFTADNYYGTSEIAFKPSFSGSKMVSSVGQPAVVNSVSGMNKTCFGDSADRCVYTK
ncbi:MAG: carbohydrate-binding domain-containing protein [Fibrobacter sp.]|nr:carbohydrate-binding domain-containing protein [Fibrobacter sp.]